MSNALNVNFGGTSATGSLPTFTAADAGKALVVDAGGNVVAQTSSNAPISSLPILTVEDGAADYLRISDATDGQEKRILVNDLMSA